MDCTLAGAVLILCIPWIGILCILIKLGSRGPAFHLQERVGLEGRRFRILKLRTMVDHAEHATGPVWATRDDPRITRIGSFLRRTHLDELPQLINVLRGEMSLVGPRPERPVFVEKFERLIPGYARRLRVKPGITGLAQVSQSYDASIADVRAKLVHDLCYVRTMSARTDFLILLRTLKHLAGHDLRRSPSLAAQPRHANRRVRGNMLHRTMIPPAPADPSPLQPYHVKRS